MAEISIFGVVVVLLLLAVAVALFVVIDRQTVKRVLKVLGLTVVQMMAIGAVVWLVYKVNAWWGYVLWYVLMLVLSVCWCLYGFRSSWKRMLVPVGAALLTGSLVAGGSVMLCLPSGTFVPVFGVLMGCLKASVSQTLQTYIRCLLHTEAHRQYMLANGATRLESLMPSVRRSLRAALMPQMKTLAQPLLVVMPMLMAGMLLAGASAWISVTAVLLLTAATFVATVVAGVVALFIASAGKP